MLKKLICTLLIILVGLQEFAYADGSRNLYPSGAKGRRAYLLTRPLNITPRAQFNPFPTPGTFKVYAKAGETIYVGSSVQGLKHYTTARTGTIYLRAPNGSTYTTTNGYIDNRSQELKGPSLAANDGGYPTVAGNGGNKLVVQAGQEGIWEVDFVGFGSGSGTNLTEEFEISADNNWNTPNPDTNGNKNGYVTSSGGQPVDVAKYDVAADYSADLILAFDVSVSKTVSGSQQLVEGRVYSNIFSATLPNNFPINGGFYGKVYMLTNHGRAYLVDNNGQNGASFSFFSNNKGVQSLGQPTYKSFNSTTDNTIPIHDPRFQDNGEIDVTHKIFFTKPSPDLPESAPVVIKQANGTSYFGTTWLKKTTPDVPAISDFTVKGAEGTPGFASIKGADFSFTSNITGSYAISIDVNKNGSYDDDEDRILSGTSVTGVNTVHWDAKNNIGQYVPPGSYGANIKAEVFGAEVHFPFSDVEINPFGIKIQLTDQNYNPMAGQDVVYWDDSNIDNHIPLLSPGANDRTSPNPFKTGATGLSSTANGHKWGKELSGTRPTGSGSGSSNAGTGQYDYGNQRILDTWTYLPSPKADLNASLVFREADLEVKSITPDLTKVGPGQSVTFTIVVRNNLIPSGGVDVQYAPFAFTAPEGFTITGFHFDKKTTDAIEHNPVISGNVFQSKLDLEVEDEIVYTITGTVGGTLLGQTILAEASIMRPADVTDINATNVEATYATTTPQSECDGLPSGPGCNNIKSNTVPPLTISGKVWRDANGDATLNGTETVTNAGGIRVYLVDESNAIIQIKTLNTDGLFSFDKVKSATSYKVVLSSSVKAVGETLLLSELPAAGGWLHTGVNLRGAGNNSNRTGIISVEVNTEHVPDNDFGIQQRPVADVKSYSIATPDSGVEIFLNGSLAGESTPPNGLTGTDTEDAPAVEGLNGNSKNRIVKIVTLPAKGELWYNGGKVTAGQIIPNYDKDLLSVKITGAGYSFISFTYAYFDAAQAESVPVEYSIVWPGPVPLPVTLATFTVAGTESAVLLHWSTSVEVNSEVFEIQRSLDAKTWNKIGDIKAAGESNQARNYSFTDQFPLEGVLYYRLKMIDRDQTFNHSTIRSITFSSAQKAIFYPNPASDKLKIKGDIRHVRSIEMNDQQGRPVGLPGALKGDEIQISHLREGLYFIKINYVNGLQKVEKIIIRR